MKHKRSQESERDNAMSKSLVEVQVAAKKWAESSNKGALVWQVANEFHELWHEWGLALSEPAWAVPKLVIHTLDKIARCTKDDAVCGSIKLAKIEMSKYREQE